MPCHDTRATWLNQAELRVTTVRSTVFGEHRTVFKGVTGTSNHGDSGGPVLDRQGRLIDVNVIGSHAAYEYALEGCTAVDVARNADWIRGVIGGEGQGA